MASEVGVLDIPPENIVLKERLHPGRIFLVDTAHGRIVSDEEIKRELAAAQPYGDWLRDNLVDIDDLPPAPYLPRPSHETVVAAAAAVRLHRRRPAAAAAPMALNGEEPIGSMGTDTALAVLSDRPHAALRLLQADVRAGDQPAARRDPRGAGDDDGVDGRARGQPARAAAGVVPADQDRVSDHRQRSAGALRHVYEPAFRSITLPTLFDPSRRTARASSARSRS